MDASITRIPRAAKLDLRGILWFVGIAYGLAWLLELPMALDGKGLNSPWASLIFFVNFTPAVATVLVARWISPLPHMRQATGLRFGVSRRKWLLYCLCGLVGFTLFNLATPFVGALVHVFPLDLQHLAGLKALLESTPDGKSIVDQVPLSTIALLILVTLPLQALLICWVNFGEEYGWRGYLLPQLLPLGQWPALLLSGAIWGFWHAPLILMGFNYPQHHILGVLLFTLFGMVFGVILGWTRLATGSVWPAVFGHAALDANQVAGGIYVLLPAKATFDTALAGITGITALILPMLFIVFLVLTKRLPVSNPPDLVPISEAPSAGMAAPDTAQPANM
jgi:membrane protease YdiL (CAAX protease family)